MYATTKTMLEVIALIVAARKTTRNVLDGPPIGDLREGSVFFEGSSGLPPLPARASEARAGSASGSWGRPDAGSSMNGVLSPGDESAMMIGDRGVRGFRDRISRGSRGSRVSRVSRGG